MANIFLRKPVDGGDNGAWAPYANAQNTSVIGVYSANLYDDSGTLKLTTGYIGINDGTNIGVSELDTIETISLAAVSNSNWAKIEMTVSGSTVTFAAADISGATDPSALPAGFTGAYDGEKGGFYITSTKRCIGLAWKNAGGTLEGIVNTVGIQEGWSGYCQSDDANNNPYYFQKLQNNIIRKYEGDFPEYSSTGGAGTLVAGTGGATSNTIIIRVPVLAYLVYNNGALVSSQNSTTDTIAGNLGGAGTTYSLMLNPGEYKLLAASGLDSANLYVTGALFTDNLEASVIVKD